MVYVVVREALLEWLATIYIASAQSKLGPLHLIFSKNLGVEAFSFISDSNTRGSEAAIPDVTAILRQRGINRLDVYQGEGSCGKTFQINK